MLATLELTFTPTIRHENVVGWKRTMQVKATDAKTACTQTGLKTVKIHDREDED